MNTQPNSLLFCHHCGRLPTEDVRLKRCVRCSVTLYCGRECQKADWPTHK
ncbi:hypothetical protein K466DRAFT_490001 [Polyporus arcularius HHB13444]|uniref:MYND-type domain-containing protein n=1 Tax=Polyporus arcularius HHB13444 TaxID=1314778 RepID=A0A5C3PEC8_9APHY|nr:hypothetical protein K466DRAFT_490001 [Polyporus arcularius HHB13444]